MAKTLIMAATALMVLSVILWMWRVEAQSSRRAPSLTMLERTSPPPPTEPEGPRVWPKNITLPARLEIPRDSSLSEVVELYYNSYEAGGNSYPVLEKHRNILVEKLASENGIQDTSAVLRAGMSLSLPRIYIVRDGDNLTKIATAVYGDGTRWKEIYRANRDIISDRNRVKAGWVLIIPET